MKPLQKKLIDYTHKKQSGGGDNLLNKNDIYDKEDGYSFKNSVVGGMSQNIYRC